MLLETTIDLPMDYRRPNPSENTHVYALPLSTDQSFDNYRRIYPSKIIDGSIHWV